MVYFTLVEILRM